MTGVWGDAFIIGWLFWSGIAIGGVVFAALLELCGGTWAGSLRVIAQRFRWFLPLSLLAYGMLVWQSPAAYSRGAIAILITYVAAFWFCRVSQSANGARTRAAVVLVIVYMAGFSVVAHDVLMSLQMTWISTLFPAYVATTCVYGGIATAALVTLASDETWSRQQRGDVAMLLVGMGLFWLYLVWSQYLVIWYGNLPDETWYLVERSRGAWAILGLVVLAARLVLPGILLLTPFGRQRVPLAVACAAVVAGYWIECLVLVGPAATQAGIVKVSLLISVALGIVWLIAVAAPTLRSSRAPAPTQSP